MAITKEKRQKMEKMIYDFFSAFDKSGTNTKKYKDQFENMSDAQFDKFFKEFFSNDKAYLPLDIVDYEHTVAIEDIEDAANVLNIPLFEYVYIPHITMDKNNVVRTPEPVAIIFLNTKRTQQTVMHKNGMSVDIDQRSAITGQVSGADKNGRESDLENIMLTSLGMKNSLKELNGPRADDIKMKQEMLRDIALNGFTRIEDMDDNLENKTALNTVNTYLLGMSIDSDLVTNGLMTIKEINKELH